jgi:hypothetical protein
MIVGGTDKIVRYWELQEYTMVSQTTIDTSIPVRIEFEPEGRQAFIAFSEYVKVYIPESGDTGRIHLLDVIPKMGNI